MTGVALEADREREKTPPPHMAALLTALPQTEHQTGLAAASPQSVNKESCGRWAVHPQSSPVSSQLVPSLPHLVLVATTLLASDLGFLLLGLLQLAPL